MEQPAGGRVVFLAINRYRRDIVDDKKTDPAAIPGPPVVPRRGGSQGQRVSTISVRLQKLNANPDEIKIKSGPCC